jgi:hypothetical protein
VGVELRPLYTADKERCVPFASKSRAVRRLGLGVVALTAVKLRSFTALEGMSGYAAGVVHSRLYYLITKHCQDH